MGNGKARNMIVTTYEISPPIPNLPQLTQASASEMDWLQEPSLRKIARGKLYREVLLAVAVVLAGMILGAILGFLGGEFIDPHLRTVFFLATCFILWGYAFFKFLYIIMTKVLLPKLDTPEKCVESFLEAIIDNNWGRAWVCLASHSKIKYSSPESLSERWKHIKSVLLQKAKQTFGEVAPVFHELLDSHYSITTSDAIVKSSPSPNVALVTATLVFTPRSGMVSGESGAELALWAGKKVLFQSTFGTIHGGDRWFLYDADVNLSILPHDGHDPNKDIGS